MSRIPRSNPPKSLTASTPMEPAKAARSGPAKFEPNRLKFSDSGELSIIEKPKPAPLRPANSTLKRAATSLQHLPKKQPKVVVNWKDKYDEVTQELRLQTERCRSLEEELGLATDQRDSLCEHNAELDRRLKSSLADGETQTAALSQRDQRILKQREKISQLENELDERTRDRDGLRVRADDLAAENARSQTDLSLKTTEYRALKDILGEQMRKYTEASASLEEHKIKLSSQTGQLTYLKMQNDVLEENNKLCATQIATLKQQIKELEEKLTLATTDRGDLVDRLEKKERELKNTTELYNAEIEKCRTTDQVLESCQAKISKYMSDLMDCRSLNEFLTQEKSQNLRRIGELTAERDALQKTVEGMFENEKVLRNTVQDLKGHIRVYCRIRPQLRSEADKQAVKIDVLDSSSMEVEKIAVNTNTNLSNKQNYKHSFTFDGIFNSASRQADVFDEVSSLIQSALDGYNVCIFAYGQTGSGKTYTMEGEAGSDEMGIVPRAIDMIFDSLPKMKSVGWSFDITASFFEIYNENIFDLLNNGKEQEHSIKMSDSKGTDVYVTNLNEERVGSAEELTRLLRVSQKNRKTAATHSNERSSRSHSIAKIRFAAEHDVRKERFVSNLNFIDLAGSESGKTSQRMDETKSINKSLAELSKVILALQSKKPHVPYRNSKLTHLLMSSLGGNSKTLMLINVSQLDECYQETVNSLRFATNVNNCRNNPTKKNVTNIN